MKKIIILLIAGIFVTGIQAQTRRYVKENENGTSWNNASGDIQLMMNELAETGGEVWVAKGSYVPAHIPGDGTTEEDKAFLMVKDVKLYGGFSGNESLPEQRDWKRNATILSGRLNEDQRAHHTVIAAGETGSACIDGFTIMEGYATRKEGEASYLHVNNEEIDRGYGGGICIRNASPALSNLIITENQAIFGGAVCIARYSSPILSNLIINMNQAGRGGGIYISYLLVSGKTFLREKKEG